MQLTVSYQTVSVFFSLARTEQPKTIKYHLENEDKELLFKFAAIYF